MKKRIYLIFTCLAGVSFGLAIVHTTHAADVDCSNSERGCYTTQNSDPMNIVRKIIKDDDSKIVETPLDDVNNTAVYGTRYTIAGTLESVRQQLGPYLQWIAFIGLSSAVILIIYNGMLLVTTPLSPDQATTVKKRIVYIAGGVVLLTGFYFILKVLLAVFVDIFVR